MYCGECGTKNDQHALYCIADGYPLQPLESSGRIRAECPQPYCGECGSSIANEAARYCTNCGCAFDTIESEAAQPVPMQHTYFNLTLLRQVLPGFLVSAGMLFLLSQIVLSILKGREQPDTFWRTHLPFSQEVLDQITFLDFSLLANLTSVSMTIGNDNFTQHITYFSIGMIFIALISVVALMIGGFVIKWLHPLIDEWKAAIFMATGYALLLGFLSLITGFSHTEGNQFTSALNFHMIGAVINGLFMGFFFSYTGMVLKKGHLKQKLDTMSFQRALYGATFAFMAGYGLMLIMTFMLSLQYEPPSYSGPMIDFNDRTGETTVAFVIKMAAYLFNLVLLNTFFIENPGPDLPVDYSFLSGVSNPGREEMGFYIPSDFFAASETLMLIITAVFFIMIGRILARSYVSFIKTLIIYSLLFALMMTFLAFHVSMIQVFEVEEVVGEAERELILFGFKIFRTFVISFLYAGVTAFIGAMTRKLV